MRNDSYNRGLCHKEPIFAPNGTTGRIEVPRDATVLVVSVKKGSLDIWLGEAGGSPPVVPEFHFGQTNRPEWVPLPNLVTVITWRAENVNVDEPVVAHLILEGPPSGYR